MADITLKGLVKRYAKVETIHGVDLDINHGEFVVFVGPSGCGKSTLLRMIAGLEDISDGELSIDNQVVNQVDPAERGVAMVFQSYALYPHMTVAENMGFGMKMNGVDKAEIDKKVSMAAKTLQMENLLQRTPKELSGGQRQRVAIGRAIVRDPRVFLFDEPLSNLDAELRVEMRLQIAKLHKELQTTMVYVTHDQVEAMTLADKIVVLRAGNIEQVGSPLELYNYPENLFVAGFIGSPKMNFMPSTVKALEGNTATIELPDGQQINIEVRDNSVTVGEKLQLGIRPEHLRLDDSGELKLAFQSEVSERLGNATYLFGQLGEIDGIKVHVNGDHQVPRYTEITLSCDLNECYLFNEAEQAVRVYQKTIK
ncbi:MULTISPECIES: ABC transporter ATP-binding protein [unclassified Agarivorans]|uniref:ABC transporter ATP-binding protein n=1 Tax=unclassified Agarivorans TaxID=2636026 RepID=UPI0010EF3AB2|nr:MULTISPECIES: sn-glycerol-3-phosphate ABC transporter ATP-binding protein UgpC [unclassified Agarivorans]MDO6765506.1 sn-glycerol-3-phosphate ABC transporter ATP-binding protein UgpC [Agarivorans sp. 1_MG-2023]GDY26666.1 ABC transporter ATP-binding protein [Agarivorans sp. Toyoura001]